MEIKRRGFVGLVAAAAGLSALNRGAAAEKLVSEEAADAAVTRGHPLSDVVYDITPMETPFFSASKRAVGDDVAENFDRVAYEWLTEHPDV